MTASACACHDRGGAAYVHILAHGLIVQLKRSAHWFSSASSSMFDVVRGIGIYHLPHLHHIYCWHHCVWI